MFDHYIIYSVPESFLDKILPTMISTIVVVLIFIFGRYLDIKIRRKEINRNWYLKIIIEPNIQIVHSFLDSIFSSVKDSMEILISAKAVKTYEEYLGIKSKEIGKFQNIKRKFELDFISLIQITFPCIADELGEFLRTLEDETTLILDKEDLKEADLDLIENNIINFKSSLFYLLYKPLNGLSSKSK